MGVRGPFIVEDAYGVIFLRDAATEKLLYIFFTMDCGLMTEPLSEWMKQYLKFGIPWEEREIYGATRGPEGGRYKNIKHVHKLIKRVEPLCFPDRPFNPRIVKNTKKIENLLRSFRAKNG